MVETNQTDEELAKASLRDKRYFDILVQRYANRILRYVGRLIGNYQEAEDITQETFLKAFINIAGFNPKLKFSSWLYRIAHNESVNFIKKHYGHKKVAFDETVLYTSSGEKTMFDKLIVQDDIHLVRQVLAQLKSQDRAILELAFFEDKSYLEIADILKIAVNSVGPSIHRAKGKMKRICEEIRN